MLSWLLPAVALAGLPPHPPIVFDLGQNPSLSAAELCFPSGLRLHVLQRDTAGLVSVTTVVGGGSAAEQPAERGAAHLVEHLWFQARPGGGDRVVDQLAGTDWSGSTYADETVYSTVAPSADLPRVLKLEAARLADPLEGVPDAAFAVERAVVRRELLWRGAHADGRALGALREALWPEGHPYRHGLGEVATLDALDRGAIRSYAERTYVPGNVTVRVEGDLPAWSNEEWSRLMESAFGERALWLRGGSCGAPPATEPPPAVTSSTVAVERGPAWFPTLYVAWSLPPAFTDDTPWQRLATQGLNDVMWDALLSVDGTARWDAHLAVDCRYVPGALAAEARCALSFPEAVDPQALVKAVGRRVGDLSLQTLADERREALADAVAARFTAAALDADSLGAGALAARARASHHQNQLFTFGAEVGALPDVPEEALATFSAKYLTKERMAAALLLPGPAAEAEPPAAAAEVVLSAPKATPWGKAKPDFGQWRRRSLSNGLTTWTLLGADFPMQRSSLVFRGGSAREPAIGTDLVGELLARFDSPVPFRKLELELSATLFHVHDLASTRMSAHTAGGDIDEAYWVLRDMLESWSLSLTERQGELDRSLDDTRNRIAVNPARSSRAYRHGHLFPEVPGVQPWWTVAGQARFVRDGAVREWMMQVMQPANGVLVTVGAVEPDQAQAAADQYLAKWKAKKQDLPPVPAAPPAPPPRAVMVLPFDAHLADVRLSCRLPGPADGRDAVLDVLEAVVDRGLWQTLRDSGRTYTPGVERVAVHEGLSVLELQATVSPGEEPGAAAALLGVLGAVHAGVSPEVLALGKQEALGAWGRSVATVSARHSTVSDAVALGLPVDKIRELPARVAKVTAADLTAALSSCVGHEAVTSVGPTGAEAFGAVGLAPRVVDWQADAQRRLKEIR